LQNFASET